MSVHKNEKNGTWYVMVRYTDWQGNYKQKCKRGFATRRDAQEWEKQFLLQKRADVNMTLESFYALYEEDLKPRVKLTTWKTKENIIIENTVNVTKVLRMNFDIPPKSSSPDIAFTMQNTRHMFEIGISKAIIIFSISAINIIIVALPRPAVDIFPLIIFNTVITGAKAFIT
jgi:hypothetical protein